jgi:amino acid transporter
VFAYLLPSTRAPVVGILVIASLPILMNVVVDLGTSQNFIKLILAGVLGWATAYFLIHLSVVILRIVEPNAGRPFRSPLVPIPQLVGSALIALAAFKIFPVEEVRNDAYLYYGIFLAVAAAASFLMNAMGGGLTSQFRRVPLAEVYRETELIEEDLPLPVEPGGPHIRHD